MKRCLLLLMVMAGFAVAPVAAQEPVVETQDGVLLDFQNVDLRMVISAIAEAGGLNVVYGDIPPRSVTLQLRQPVPRSTLRDVLQTLAESNQLQLEEREGLIRVFREQPQVNRPVEVPSQSPTERRLYVYRLKHAQAPRVAQTLSALFGGGTGAQSVAMPSTSAGNRSARTRRIPPTVFQQEPQADVRVGPVRFPALSKDVADEVQIVPDELTNSLLIRATAVDYEVVKVAVEALDLRPLQVLIEVLIVEVRRERNREVGVSLGQIDSLSRPFDDRVSGSLRGGTSGDLQLTIRDLGHWDVDAAVSILAAHGNVHVLSRPVILAQNNQEAHILVGAERPFVQVFRSLPTESAIRDQIVQYRDVGTELTITPTINLDGYVNLDVLQEVSTATSETQFGAPVISTREAGTRLFVKDGQSVVIGGLIEEQRDFTRSGIPLLKDIPVLGYFFGTTRDRRIQSELFLFLTPHLISTDDDADRVKQSVEGQTRMLPDLPPPLVAPRTSRVDTIVPPPVR